MTDVDYRVVGTGFAGSSAALRLKQAGRSVVLLEKRLDDNVLSKPAHQLLEMAIACCYTFAASEMSFLFVLYRMASGGEPRFILGVADAAQVGTGRS